MRANTVAKSEKDWQTESDAQTLIRAKEIQQDPKRYKAALAWCKKQCSALDKVIGKEGK